MHIIFLKIVYIVYRFCLDISLCYILLNINFRKTAGYLFMLHIHFRKQRSPMNLYILTSSKIRNKIAKLISFNIVGIGMSLLICHLQLHVLKPRINWQLQYWKNPQTFQHGNEVYARMDIHREG